MSSFMKKIQNSSMATCIICLILGVLLCIWPGQIVTKLFQIMGIIIVLCGVVFLGLAMAIHEFAGRLGRLVPGIVCVLFGMAMYAKPESCLKVVPVLIGLILIYHGIRHIIFAYRAKQEDKKGWISSMVFAVLTVVFGVILVAYAWQAALVGLRILGFLLIYDAATGIWINLKK